MTPQLKQLPVSSLITEHNIRQDYGDLEALASTFEGEPDEFPTVSPNGSGDTYTVIHGNRRVQAARQQGITHLHCIVKEIDLGDLHLRQLIADLQHQSLSPIERARGMRQLMARGWSQKEVADKLGVSKSEVSRTLALLDLCQEAQQAVAEDHICMGIAEMMIPLDPETQAEVLPKILASKGQRSGKATVAKARRVIAENTLTEEEKQAKEDEAQARAMIRAMEERKTNHQSDEYDAWLDKGEPAQAVHLLYYVQQAAREVEAAAAAYNLNGCSKELKQAIYTQAERLGAVAENIQEMVK